MKKTLLFGFLLCSLQATASENIGQAYQNFKNNLQNKTGLTYSIDVSALGQRGAPNGEGTAWQTQYYGTANWDMFKSRDWGQGSAQIAYTAVRYWGKNANVIGDNIGVITPINDYTQNANYFDQLSYTHQMPNKLKGLSVTLGQFPMYNFDGTDYNSNQQINFINYALSQNGTSAYPTASLGGFATLTFNPEWSAIIGAQNANNVDGYTISTKQFGKGNFTSFASLSWTPTFYGLSGQYSVLFYNQPSVYGQAVQSKGWSINAQQNVTKDIALFLRANGTNKSLETAKQSYVLGGVWNNPCGRNALDQLGIAAAFNKLNTSVNGSGTRAWENVFEAYYSVGLSDFLILTPDVQFYVNPGENPDSHTATVASIRATFMF